MKPDELFLLGKIVRSFGPKGELVCQLDAEILSKLKKLESVYLKINEDLVPFFIEYLQPRPKNQAIVKFLDIDTPEEAETLGSCSVYIPNTLLPKRKGVSLQSNEIEGYTVIDAIKGEIGFVSNLLELPQQILLEINFDGKEILVPVVDEIVKSIDSKNKVIHIEAPEGLIDLYL